MHYRLLSRKALRVTRPTRGGVPARIAFLLLAGGLAVGGAIQWRAHAISQETAQSVVPKQGRQIPALPPIPETRVPLPPAVYGLEPAKGSQPSGTHTLRPRGSTLSPARSKELFHFYQSAMRTEGWALQSQATPTSGGEWAQYWQLGGQIAVIQMFTSPKVELVVTYCPPAPFC